MKKLFFTLILAALPAVCAAAGKVPAARAESAPLPAYPAGEARPRFLVASFSGVISPVAAEYLAEAVGRANAGADALVIRLDTPGGLDLAMRDIIKEMMAAKVPVIVYVSPSGARAASAGVFIGMAANVLAMAPGTNIGAAHPVMLGASGVSESKDDKKDPMESKVLNDASAYLKSISAQRGRNADWALKAVSKSDSVTADEAVKLNVADFVASDMDDLLARLDGREIAGFGSFRAKGAALEFFEQTRRQKFLSTISDPNVAMILMSVGAAGILIELYNPGLILPGIAGALSLITAFYSFHTLSANFAGVLFILLGIILFFAEWHVASYGLLTTGGIISLVMGVMMLFKGVPTMGIGVTLSVLLSTVGGLLLIALLIGIVVLRAQLRKVETGAESLIGQKGKAKTAISASGKVFIQGELWDAVSSSGEIAEGSSVKVESMAGLVLTVSKL
ncbi:MAG: nodulation protein NfeD [Elusimicrobiales bacterium]